MPAILHHLRRIPAPASDSPLLSALADLHHSSRPRQAQPSYQPIALRFAPALQRTRTLAQAASRALRLLPRQDGHATSTIPSIYGAQRHGPDSGTVAGITLGSVAGFLLLLWLVYTCLNAGNPNGDALAESEVVSVGTASVVRERSATRRRASKHRHSGGGRRETVEIRTTGRGAGGPVIVEGRPGSRIREVTVEETNRYSGGGRSVSRGPSRPRPPPMMSRPPRTVTSEDEDSEEDEIVVVEERSPPRRQRSRRPDSRESRGGRYREVETDDVVMRERRESRRR